MPDLKPWKVKVREYGLYESIIDIVPASGHDCNWTATVNGGEFYWKTKKSAIQNLERIYGEAKEI